MDLPAALSPEHENTLLAAVADRWPGPPVDETDRVARLLIASWERAEGTPVNPSYVATFVDMARAVVADREARIELVRPAARGGVESGGGAE